MNSFRNTSCIGQANQQMAGFFQDIVMEKAMNDRLGAAQSINRMDTPGAQQEESISLLDSEVNTDETTQLDSFDGDDDDLDTIRNRRLAEIANSAKMMAKYQSLGHGVYTELVETEFLDAVIKSPRAVVHFYHNEYVRCRVVDARLSEAAALVMGCRFLKVNAEKCPFFVTKLQVKVLPTIIYFVGGKTVHRVTGFTEYGGSNDFSVSALLRSLKSHKMLMGSEEEKYTPFLTDTQDDSDDSD
jgi:hypothetical protein